MSRPAAPAPLVSGASAYYRHVGPFAWRFARGKLAHDPAFTAILAHDLLAGRRRILDLGCGQGLLAAWLLAAASCHASARAAAWPHAWPAPPDLQSYVGVEINAHEVARARRAFALDTGAAVRIVHGDIRDVDYEPSDAVVLLDVLHYLDYPAQEKILARVRTMLAPRGVLLLRIGDAAAGGFALSKALDRTVVLVRRRRWLPLHCRTLAEWRSILDDHGFHSRALPMSAGRPFCDVLLRAEVP